MEAFYFLGGLALVFVGLGFMIHGQPIIKITIGK